MIVTLAAGLILAAMLFLVFRSAQAASAASTRQLIESTRRDALTGMLNHGAIVALLAEELESARVADAPIGVALLDVDNFRLFNDNHGHEAADEVLLQVAELVGTRPADEHVARYGPDEFLLVRTGAASRTMAAVDGAPASRLEESVSGLATPSSCRSASAPASRLPGARRIGHRAALGRRHGPRRGEGQWG